MPTAYSPQPRAAKRATVAEPIMPWALYRNECHVFRPWNATSRYSSDGVMKNRLAPRVTCRVFGRSSRLGDLVTALDQERRRAQHERQQRRPREHLLPQRAGEQQMAAAGVDTDARSRAMPEEAKRAPLNLNVASTNTLEASRRQSSPREKPASPCEPARLVAR